MRIALALLVAACGGSAPKPTMASFTVSGYTLTSAEYWPYVGEKDIDYPAAVLWGFYPEKGVVPDGETDPNPASARPEAVACAEKAFAALKGWLATDPPVLKKIVAAKTADGTMVPRFYLWTNDYGLAASPFPPGMREARLWWWARKQPEPPKPPGYWKWESVLTQSGECVIPHQPQIDQYLAEMAAKLP